MGTTVASSVADSCWKVCWLPSGSTPVVAPSLWPLSELLSKTLVLVSVVGYTIYGIIFRFWIMATWSTRLFSYSYLIQLLMQWTLKVLKHVNCHLHSLLKFTNETRKTLCNHFWCGIWKFDTLFSIIYFWFNKITLGIFCCIWTTYHVLVDHQKRHLIPCLSSAEILLSLFGFYQQLVSYVRIYTNMYTSMYIINYVRIKNFKNWVHMCIHR